VLDLGAGLQKGSYLMSDTTFEADARALMSDWAAIDRDFAVAASRLIHEQEEEAK
jgi:hypothetical protein